MAQMSTPQVSNISAQQMIDARLNAFAVDLLLESYAPATRDGAAAEPPAPILFAYRGVLVALAPLEASDVTIAPAAARLRALLTTETAEGEAAGDEPIALRAGDSYHTPFRWNPAAGVWEFYVESWGGWCVLRKGPKGDAEPLTFEEGRAYLGDRPDHPIVSYEETREQARALDNTLRVRIIADTHAHGEMIARHLGIPRTGWRLVRDRHDLAGVRKDSRVAIANLRDGNTPRMRQAEEYALAAGMSIEYVDLDRV